MKFGKEVKMILVVDIWIHSLDNPICVSISVIQPPNNAEEYGEMGKGVKLDHIDTDTKAKIDKGWKDNAFNQYYSDLISLDRSLPDFR